MRHWMIKDHNGALLLSQGVWITRKFAQFRALDYARKNKMKIVPTWSALYRFGFRIVPVRVTELKR